MRSSSIKPVRSRTREPPPGWPISRFRAIFWGVLGRGTGRKRSGTPVGFIWVDSRGLATILDTFRAIFVHLGPDRLSETSTSVLSQQQTSVLSQQQTSVLSQQQTSVLSQQQISVLSSQKTTILSQLLCSLRRIIFFKPSKPILPATVGGNFAKRLQGPSSKRTPPLMEGGGAEHPWILLLWLLCIAALC